MRPKITIIGCGPGAEEYLTAEAVQAAARADVLIGATKLLGLFPNNEAKRISITSNIEEILEDVEAHRQLKCAVLVTGDPGVFSIAKRTIDRFGVDNCRVIPGISAVQVAFARIGLDWADARIISAHYQLPSPKATDTLLGFQKIAVLMGHCESFEWVHSLLGKCTAPFRIVVCENLSSADERVSEIRPDELLSCQYSFCSIVLILLERIRS
jgi:precorrin-6y C5,15-methyltransferase (decarboxylating) CbiE subunit